jgi:hypothetical protein
MFCLFVFGRLVVCFVVFFCVCVCVFVFGLIVFFFLKLPMKCLMMFENQQYSGNELRLVYLFISC